MEPLNELQINASLSLQECSLKMDAFMEAFVSSMGGMPVIKEMLVKFKDTCISYGRLQVTLENTLKNDTKSI